MSGLATGLLRWLGLPFVLSCVVAVLCAAGTVFLGSGLDLRATAALSRCAPLGRYAAVRRASVPPSA